MKMYARKAVRLTTRSKDVRKYTERTTALHYTDPATHYASGANEALLFVTGMQSGTVLRLVTLLNL